MEATYLHDIVQGPTLVVVDTPELPVEITVDDRHANPVDAVLVAPNAHSVFVGNAGTDTVYVEALISARGGRRGRSQTAFANGNSTIIQVGGDLNLGGSSRKPGAYVSAPKGCTFDIRAHDGITVYYNGTEMTIEAAAEIGVLERA